MNRESLLRFIVTGMAVLPAILAIGTGSLDAVAFSLFALLLLMLATLLINPDDPIGDKLKAEARDEDDAPH